MEIKFTAFWERYPRKLGKRDAEKAWNSLKVTTQMGYHIFALLDKRKREDWRDREPRYIPYPAHFLRSECFDDEVEAKVDDPLPALATATPCTHICSWCESRHTWECGDEFCCLSPVVACPQFRARYQTAKA
jgi:hypothetical protein